MRTEIELKARIDDPAALEETLRKEASFQNDYYKKDSYFRTRNGFEFRLRDEGEYGYLTIKQKNRDKGLELNQEFETRVDDIRVLEKLVSYFDCEIFCRKEKSGKLFKLDDVNLELLEIKQLGHFLEMEILVDDPSPEMIKKSREKLEGFLDQFKIPREKIEERFYTEMLLCKKT